MDEFFPHVLVRILQVLGNSDLMAGPLTLNTHFKCIKTMISTAS